MVRLGSWWIVARGRRDRSPCQKVSKELKGDGLRLHQTGFLTCIHHFPRRLVILPLRTIKTRTHTCIWSGLSHASAQPSKASRAPKDRMTQESRPGSHRMMDRQKQNFNTTVSDVPQKHMHPFGPACVEDLALPFESGVTYRKRARLTVATVAGLSDRH